MVPVIEQSDLAHGASKFNELDDGGVNRRLIFYYKLSLLSG
jgi:hypothetical protein